MGMEGKTCSCGHHMFVPILVIAFGLVFLLGALDVLNAATVAILWPIVVLVGGAAMLFGKKCKCC